MYLNYKRGRLFYVLPGLFPLWLIHQSKGDWKRIIKLIKQNKCTIFQWDSKWITTAGRVECGLDLFEIFIVHPEIPHDATDQLPEERDAAADVTLSPRAAGCKWLWIGRCWVSEAGSLTFIKSFSPFPFINL